MAGRYVLVDVAGVAEGLGERVDVLTNVDDDRGKGGSGDAVTDGDAALVGSALNVHHPQRCIYVSSPSYTHPDAHVSHTMTLLRPARTGWTRCQIHRAMFSLVGFSRPWTSLR